MHAFVQVIIRSQVIVVIKTLPHIHTTMHDLEVIAGQSRHSYALILFINEI